MELSSITEEVFIVSYPFDCISDFMFFETEVKKSDVILIPGASHPQLID